MRDAKVDITLTGAAGLSFESHFNHSVSRTGAREAGLRLGHFRYRHYS